MSYSPWLVPKVSDPAGKAPRPETGPVQRTARVVLPEENQAAIAPIVWKEVNSPAIPAEKKPAEPPPDFSAQAAQLNQQWEQKTKEAYAAGAREGEQTGRGRAAAELQPVIDRLGRSIEELHELRPRLRREAESDTVRLALAIARRVLRRELAIDAEALHGLVLAALEKLQGQEISRVKVHPAQAAAVSALLRNSAHHPGLEATADASLEPGGVTFETTHGDLDVSVDSQLQEIERGLTDRMRRLT